MNKKICENFETIRKSFSVITFKSPFENKSPEILWKAAFAKSKSHGIRDFFN